MPGPRRRRLGDPDVRADWLALAPALLTPHGLTPPGGPRTVSATDMDQALRRDQARGLGPGLPGAARHDGKWWVHEHGGTWLQVTDQVLTARLDRAAAAWERAQTAADHEPTP